MIANEQAAGLSETAANAEPGNGEADSGKANLTASSGNPGLALMDPGADRAAETPGAQPAGAAGTKERGEAKAQGLPEKPADAATAKPGETGVPVRGTQAADPDTAQQGTASPRTGTEAAGADGKRAGSGAGAADPALDSPAESVRQGHVAETSAGRPAEPAGGERQAGMAAAGHPGQAGAARQAPAANPAGKQDTATPVETAVKAAASSSSSPAAAERVSASQQGVQPEAGELATKEGRGNVSGRVSAGLNTDTLPASQSGVAANGKQPPQQLSPLQAEQQTAEPEPEVSQTAALQSNKAGLNAAPAAQGGVQAFAAGQGMNGSSQRANAAAVAGSGAAAEEAAEEAEASAAADRLVSKSVKRGDFRAAPANQPSAAVQMAAASAQLRPPGGVTAVNSESDLLGGSGETLSGVLGLSGDAPGLTQLLAEASFGTGTVHRPETPRMIAAQMAEAFAAKGEQKVEISLNPQELGQVKMRVMASESGITMVIHTERPETGDLMRRHIHELAEEFRRMGYEDISFEFSGGQAGGGHAGQEPDGGAAQSGSAARGSDTAEAQEPATQNLRLGNSGVDMRV
ncbi:hypothetical protein RA19_11715 [Leisingera sp. ANG-M1]|nr:hypothetical protein RA19_11715 [Leisingera sp. ANG-M1]